MKFHSFTSLAFVLYLFIGLNSQSQTAITDADWFSLGGIPGASRDVISMAADSAGNIYVGGDFDVVGNVNAWRIAKWDGTSWSALGSGVGGVPDTGNFYVDAIAPSGSDLYAGGSFIRAGSVAATNIARWNGTDWSALGQGVGGGQAGDSRVFALAASDGELYVGGAFTLAGGLPANHVAVWNGESWSPLGSGLTNYVLALAVVGSKVYAGTSSGLFVWNGTDWTGVGSGLAGDVFTLAVSGTDLYVGGIFNINGSQNIARWDGANWYPLGSGLEYAVKAIALSGSNVYAGPFNGDAAIDAQNIARWDGASWSTVPSTMDQPVASLATSGSDLYAGGAFTQVEGIGATHIAKWNGNAWSALGSGLNNIVSALAGSGSNLYLGGAFTTAANQLPANHVVQRNGSTWATLGSGMDADVRALVASGTNLYAGGSFTNAGGVPAQGVARWDGAAWSALGSGIAPGPLSTGPVFALAVWGNALYAGGSFTNAGGTITTNIAKWNGSAWSALGFGIDRGNFGMAVYSIASTGNTLYVGGNFLGAGSVDLNNIAQWDGANWSSLGPGLTNPTYGVAVYALAISGTNLYAAGNFLNAGSLAVNNIAKWDGTSWSALGSGVNDQVYALAVVGNDLYAAGLFTSAGGVDAAYIAKWDGTQWSALGSGLDNYGYALLASGSDLLTGGAFTLAGQNVSGYVASVHIGSSAPFLAISRSGPDVLLLWPSAGSTGFLLEQSPTLNMPTSWTASGATITDDGTNKSATLPAINSQQFFRLHKP